MIDFHALRRGPLVLIWSKVFQSLRLYRYNARAFLFPPLPGPAQANRCRFLIRPDEYAMVFLSFFRFFVSAGRMADTSRCRFVRKPGG